jgi:hypothetical protein
VNFRFLRTPPSVLVSEIPPQIIPRIPHRNFDEAVGPQNTRSHQLQEILEEVYELKTKGFGFLHLIWQINYCELSFRKCKMLTIVKYKETIHLVIFNARI